MGLLTLAMAFGLGNPPAFGDGVGLVLNSKSLPDATVAVIDPESGTSSGGSGSDVNLAVGDIILFRFEFAAVPDKALHGQMAYLTEYVPDNTEVVGVRILGPDDTGRLVTIEPFYPGLAEDGCTKCGYGPIAGGYSGEDCGASVCAFPEGSMSQLIGDTGVFFSTDARTAHTPSTELLTTNNGTPMTGALPTSITNINGLIGDSSAPFFAHNIWDFLQVQVFGVRGGNTAHGYGSPVAGPDTHYGLEITKDSTQLEFLDNVGPWQRIQYPGSLIGTGAGAADNGLGRTGAQTTAGTDVTPANPVANANAVRFALGEARTGVPMFAEIALRVTGVPLDSTFVDPLLPGGGGNVDCAEVFGSDLSADFSAGNRGQDNGWALYMGSPTCVFLRNKFDLLVDQPVYSQNGDLHYTLNGSNLSLNTETGAEACIKYDGSAFSFVSGTASPAPTSTTCIDTSCGDTSTLNNCLIYTLGDLAPGADYTIDVDFTPQGVNGKDAVTTQAVYSSDQATIDGGTLKGGFTTQALSIVTAIPIPDVDLSVDWDPVAAFASEGQTRTIVGTLSNLGTNAFTPKDFFVHLPAGWALADSGGDADEDVTIDADRMDCDSSKVINRCGTSNPILGFGTGGSVSIVAGEAHTVTFDVVIPGGGATPDGLYTIDIGVNYSSTGFGATSQSYFHDAITVNVGQRRSEIPILDCPIGSTNPTITGTTDEAQNTEIRTYFNLMDRGGALTVVNGPTPWSVTPDVSFGGMYGGLEVRATARAPGELESELSEPCEVTSQRACSDGFDNDGDGIIDFPADPGCDSPTDNDEADPAVSQCADGIDNDGDGVADFAGTTGFATDPNLLADNGCSGPDDTTEDNVPECSAADGADNDSDGLTDFAGGDPGCDDANDANELDLAQCQNYIDDDLDGLIDFAGLDQDDSGTVDVNADPGCSSAFDDDEVDDPVSTDIKARLLVVMDTSGSMNFNTCDSTFTGGDGSTECPGLDVDTATCSSDTSSNSQPDDSRMAKVKTGMNNVIAGFGEVEFGLMRYAQRDEEFVCPSAAASQRSGGWQGGGIAPCAGGFNEGELLVDFGGENQDELLAWMDGESNYVGIDPEIVPAGMDHELRGSGTTPIGGSLASANSFLFNKNAADPVGACRPYSVVLVTDGDETCGGDPVNEATLLAAAGFNVYVIGFATSDPQTNQNLDDIAAAGNTGSAIIVDDSAALSQAMADIITDTILVERCNGLDDDCDTEVDEDFTNLGDTCDNGELTQCFQTGVFVCAADELGTECNAPAGTPLTEVCDGLDNDCNGLVDESFPVPCTCVPTLEICNGVDDDCDFSTDEDTAADPLPGVGDTCGFSVGICSAGTLACTAGNFVCSGSTDPELEDDINTDCDGEDDDCDTVVDEVSVVCYDPDDNTGTVDPGCNLGTGLCLGLCQTGLRGCLGGGAGPGLCDGDIGPITEICNGLDDDCDGIDDNGFPVGDTCDNGQQGECLVNGTVICDPTDSEGDGDFVQCTAFQVPPGIEICNGLDDDCDGSTDEDTILEPLPAPIGNTCGGTGTSCNAGIIECINGAPSCEGVVGGDPEICDGQDNDCDNLTDEDTAGEPLPGIGLQCYDFALGCTGAGTPQAACEGTCNFGATICVAGGIECDGAIGPAAEESCDGVDNDCDGNVDEAATCPAPNDICFGGECVGPCGMGEFPCPVDFFCQAVPNEGDFCTTDPCVAIQCADTEDCDPVASACFDPCDTTTCLAGQTCLLGECNDCFDFGFECAEDENCVIGDTPGIGECVLDLCFNTTCQEGEFCSGGDCIPLECEPACASGELCTNGVCVADLCGGVDCGTKICDPTSGECVRDVCENKFCPQGTACDPGTGDCINDPCLELTCPEPLVCEVAFDGTGQCVEVVEPEAEGEWIAPGGGGGCATGGTQSSSGLSGLLLFGIAGLGLRRRRRRCRK